MNIKIMLTFCNGLGCKAVADREISVKSTLSLAHVTSIPCCIILFMIFQYFSNFSLIFLAFSMYFYKLCDL
jgi:hypothetical protein